MKPRHMLIKQSNSIALAIPTEQWNITDFRWEEEKSKSSSQTIDVLIHKDSGYYFKFDYSDGDMFGNDKGRIARYSPGTEHVHEYASCSSWERILGLFKSWLRDLRKELEPDLWDSSEPDEFGAWSDSGQRFKPNELKKINEGLERVERLLIEHSDKTEGTIKDIKDNVEFLKESAKKSNKREFKYIFIGLIINKLADWAIKTISIQHVILTLVQDVKNILPGN